MCECERGFRFWLKACLGERGFRLVCVGVSAVLIITAYSEAMRASRSAEKHCVGIKLNHLFAFGYCVYLVLFCMVQCSVDQQQCFSDLSDL